MILIISRKFCGLTKTIANFFDTTMPPIWREDGAAYSQNNTIPTKKHGGGNTMAWGCFAYSET